MSHPKTKAERRKSDIYHAKRHIRAAANIFPYNHMMHPSLWKYSKQDFFDCGNPKCAICHPTDYRKPVLYPLVEDSYE